MLRTLKNGASCKIRQRDVYRERPQKAQKTACDSCAFWGRRAFLARSHPILKKTKPQVRRHDDLPRCDFCKRLAQVCLASRHFVRTQPQLPVTGESCGQAAFPPRFSRVMHHALSRLIDCRAPRSPGKWTIMLKWVGRAGAFQRPSIRSSPPRGRGPPSPPIDDSP